MMQDWVEKYRPKSLADIIGNRDTVRRMLEWARDWDASKPPLLLFGKPGIGKTSSAYALANDMNWEVVELNASDQRTKGIIEKIAGSTATTMSLLGSQRKLILLDEADNLHGTADQGGARAIISVIKSSKQPIILIANDKYGVAKEIKALCEPLQFRALQARSIVPHLKYICSAENKTCSENALMQIAESAGGDMRAAVNMLFAAGSGSENVSEESVSTAAKDQRSTIFELVGGILRGGEDRRLMEMSYDLSDTPDTVEQWIEGALPQISTLRGRSDAYGFLAQSDIYLGRTYLRQYYTLWKYATALMIIGTASAAGGRGVTGSIMPPARWAKMAGAKKKKLIRQSVLIKAAFAYHMPENTLRDEYFKAFGMIADKDPLSLAKELSLDADELNYILEDKARTTAVMNEIKREAKELEKKEKAAQKAAEKAKKSVKPVRTIDITKAVADAGENPPEKTSHGKASETAKAAKTDKTEKTDSKEFFESTEPTESKKINGSAEPKEPTESKSAEKKPSETQSTLFSF